MNDVYEIYAIKYAQRGGVARDHFIVADAHDLPMPMDYFVWVIKSVERSVVVDIGFTADEAERRKREHLRCPAEALQLVGVDAETVENVVITHLHYDHAGNVDKFPNATFHLQDDEMIFATGRSMRHKFFRAAYNVEDVVGMVRALYGGRVQFHDGDSDLAPGISLHAMPGHTRGMQSVRVNTSRGQVMLASDASHFMGNLTRRNPFVLAHSVQDMLDSFVRLEALAESQEHIIPGHDPLVMRCYPAASPELEGIVARLDLEPHASMVAASRKKH